MVMAKRFHKIRYNEQTLRMEQVPFDLKDYVLLAVKRVGVLVLISFGSIYIFDTYFESPTDRAQRREITFLEDRLGKMDADMQDMAIILGDISDRDDAIYRSIFGVESYPSHLRNPGIGGIDRSRALRGYDHSQAVISSEERLAELQRKLVAQSRSFEEVLDLAKTKPNYSSPSQLSSRCATRN